MNCPACDGTGKNWMEYELTGEEYFEYCPLCGGDGELDQEACDHFGIKDNRDLMSEGEEDEIL